MEVTLNYGTGVNGIGQTTTANQQLNTYAHVVSIDSNNLTLTIGTPSVGLIGAFCANDEIMIHVSGGVDTTYVGNYGFYTIQSISGSTMLLNTSCAKVISYNLLNVCVVQVIKVPNYTDFILNTGHSIVAPAYNGQYGGIVALRASGKLKLNGVISVNKAGYATDHSQPNGGGNAILYNGNYAGGGGGGHRYVGGQGGIDQSDGISRAGAPGAQISNDENLKNGKMYFGGAGGRGANGTNAYSSNTGGRGGGIIYIGALNITLGIAQAISANGGGGGAGGTSCGGNGAGAGGSICVLSPNISGIGLNNYCVGATGGGGGGAQTSGVAGNDGDNTCGGSGGSGHMTSYVGSAGCQANGGGGGGDMEKNSYTATSTLPGQGGNGSNVAGGGGGAGGYIAIYTNSDISNIVTYPTVYTEVIDKAPNTPSDLNPTGSQVAPEILATLTPTISWLFTDPDTGNNQSAYHIVIKNAIDSSVVIDTGKVISGNNSYMVSEGILQPNTVYNWTLDVWDNYDAKNIDSPTPQYFKTTQAPVATPISPLGIISNPSGSSQTPRLSWNYEDAENDEQIKYQVQIKQIDNSVIYDSGIVASGDSYIDVPDGILLANVEYCWTVQVTDSTNMKSQWTEPQYFLTNVPPKTPTIISPIDTYRTTKRPIFEFTANNDIEDDSQAFVIQISENIDFTNAITIDSTSSILGWKHYSDNAWLNFSEEGKVSAADIEGENVQYTMQQDLNEGKTYYWRTAGKDGSTDALGNWTIPQTIRVGNVLSFKLKTPIETPIAASRMVFKQIENIAADGEKPAEIKVEVCNNGLDASPTWENATDQYFNGQYYKLTNQEKTADKWALDVKVTITANDSLGTIEILGFGFSFD